MFQALRHAPAGAAARLPVGLGVGEPRGQGAGVGGSGVDSIEQAGEVRGQHRPILRGRPASTVGWPARPTGGQRGAHANTRCGPANAEPAKARATHGFARAGRLARSSREVVLMSSVLQDVRYAIRTLGRAPGSPRSSSSRWPSASAPIPPSSACSTRWCCARSPSSPRAQLVQLDGPGTFRGRTTLDRAFSHPMFRDLQQGTTGFSALVARAPASVSFRVGDDQRAGGRRDGVGQHLRGARAPRRRWAASSPPPRTS